MKMAEAFPSNYLRAVDLQNKNVTVTIDRVEMETIGQGRNREDKPVIYFKGKEKGVVLNKTNGNKIADICGSDDSDDWIGKQIVLFPCQVEFQGDQVDAIRVKAPGAAGKKAAPPPPPAEEEATEDSSIPF